MKPIPQHGQIRQRKQRMQPVEQVRNETHGPEFSSQLRRLAPLQPKGVVRGNPMLLIK